MLRWCTAAVLAVQMALPASMLAQQSAPAQTSATAAGTPAADAPSQAESPDPMLPAQSVMLQQHPAAATMPHDEALLLVLDRFTYGPRPGDLGRMRARGLNGWFHQQLNPQTIDDHALDEKLARYPAMQMPLDRLMEMYPSNNQIKQFMNKGGYMPGGEAAHAIYADQAEQYKQKKAKKDGDAPKTAPVADLAQSPAQILALPPDKRFKALCHLTLPQLRALRQSLNQDQRSQLTDGMTPQQVEAFAAFNGPSGVVQAEDIQVKLLRDVYSERQLQEVMVDFWLNHFNVYMKKSQQAPYYIAAYERTAIRPHALGRFEDLLLATASSPAMLNYLDNSSSVGPHSVYASGGNYGYRGAPKPPRKDIGLNENYAREVMELHTVGVNGGYTQKDVTELAKVFTGWTVGKGLGKDVDAVAEYDATKHEPGTKVVMGMKVKENGEQEGVEVLKMLAATPQCARFISTKLAVRFVTDDPPAAMIDRMAQTYLETHGDIRMVILAMVNSPEFFTAANFRTKLKTPQDFVISAVRATGADVLSTAGMQAAVAELGMPLYGMQTPNGYSMKAEAWNSTSQLVSRMNFAMALASNRVDGIRSDPAALLGAAPAGMTPEQKTQRLEDVLLHGLISDKTQRLILAQVNTDEAQQAAEMHQVAGMRGNDPLHLGGTKQAPVDTSAALAAGLILGSPEFQRR
jgi:uncharacterized protein (DUF1800 family)